VKRVSKKKQLQIERFSRDDHANDEVVSRVFIDQREFK
jgi:hypothetical protein